ncbi:hypothetical protein [Singulisphaera sp. PoT]|uniref:hypothetical protein n=1 Tax=Singulisphaera sp. PoT TaxID=3411797 RepID=UPI003BF4D177
MATSEQKGADTPQSTGQNHPVQEIRLYSRSDIFYWWPLWALGYILALITYIDGGRLAVVPNGTIARRDWHVEVAPGKSEVREGLILPHGASLLPEHPIHGGPVQSKQAWSAPEQPHTHIASSPYLGTWLLVTILAVFVSTHAPLRGLWEWVSVLFIALIVTVIALYGLWGTIRGWFLLLHVQISMAGYIFLSTWLFSIWLVTFLYFDRLTYIIFSTGQVRVRQAIGEGVRWTPLSRPKNGDPSLLSNQAVVALSAR